MFLIATKRRYVSLACLLFLAPGISLAADPSTACFVDLPVYDATGNRVPFKVVAVSLQESPATNFLTVRESKYRMKVNGERLYFPKAWIGSRQFLLTLSSAKGVRFTAPLTVLACEQRISLQYGQSESGGDVGWTTIRGRFVGCSLSGDWWVRAMPMFGGNEFRPSFEGSIRLADGNFEFNASVRGERHILVAGKDKQPLKTFGIDVMAGRQNDVGTLDLSGACPK